MDLAAWQTRTTSDPTAAAALFTERCQALPSAQQKAIWAHLGDAEAWTTSAPTDAPLYGVPFASKDLFHQAGVPTRAGGILPARPARRDGALVARLRELGALPVGKTHLHEFAYGLTGENPHYGNVDHPGFPGHDAGGSSSGSAAAVAAGLVPFALGTDTGGSLRVPAAFSGLYSWRETPHHAWISDAFPLAPSFDTAGWLTRTIEDLRRVHVALHGDFAATETTPRGAWISPAVFGDERLPENQQHLSAVANRFTDKVLDADDPFCRALQDCTLPYSILQSTEAYAIHQGTLDSRRADYGEAVWQRIDRGRRWTAAQLEAAQVKHMQVRLAFARFFETHDFVILPVSIEPAPKQGQLTQELRDSLLNFTTPVSLAGLPALTVPVPLPSGLSLGVQIVFPSVRSSAINWIMTRCESC